VTWRHPPGDPLRRSPSTAPPRCERLRGESDGRSAPTLGRAHHARPLPTGPPSQAPVFPGEEPKTVRPSLEAGDRVPEHRHPERTVVCHVLEGTLELTLGDAIRELEVGGVMRFDGDQPISPAAVTDATALPVLPVRRA